MCARHDRNDTEITESSSAHEIKWAATNKNPTKERAHSMNGVRIENKLDANKVVNKKAEKE